MSHNVIVVVDGSHAEVVVAAVQGIAAGTAVRVSRVSTLKNVSLVKGRLYTAWLDCLILNSNCELDEDILN